MQRKKKKQEILNVLADNPKITKNNLYLKIGGDRTVFFEILKECETNSEIIVTKKGQHEEITLYPIDARCKKLFEEFGLKRAPFKNYVSAFEKYQKKELTKNDKEELYNLGFMFCYSCKSISEYLKLMTIIPVFGVHLAKVSDNMARQYDKTLNKILGIIYKLDPRVFERVIHNVFGNQLNDFLPSQKAVQEIFKIIERNTITRAKIFKLIETVQNAES